MRSLAALFILGMAVALVGCSVDDRSLLGASVDATVPSIGTSTTSTTTPPTTTTSSLAPASTTPPPEPPLVVGFAGDTSFTHGLSSYDPFGEVAGLLSAPDLMFVNLETTIAEADVGQAYAKKYTFKSPPDSTGLLIAAGISGVALGNNHLLDFGEPALVRTMELLDEAAVARAGAGTDKEEAYAPMVFEVAGRRVAVLSFSRILSQPAWAADIDRAGIASAYEDWIPETVQAIQVAGLNADLVAVMVHWGIELNYCPESYQRDLAAAWVEAGADLVVGSHPHVLQGVEQIGDAWIVYSTGNFAFPSARGLSDDGAIFEFAFDEAGVSLTARPIHIITGRPHPATEEQRSKILELLSEHSFGWTFDETGAAVPSEEPGKCG